MVNLPEAVMQFLGSVHNPPTEGDADLLAEIITGFMAAAFEKGLDEARGIYRKKHQRSSCVVFLGKTCQCFDCLCANRQQDMAILRE